MESATPSARPTHISTTLPYVDPNMITVVGPYPHQVAGHPNTILSIRIPSHTETLVAKRSSATEIQFVESIATHGQTSGLHQFLPVVIGVSCLPFQAAQASTESESQSPSLTLIMTDLVAQFRYPNITDIKLGTRLYGIHVTQEKADRMRKQSVITTSGSCGIRICGIRIYNPESLDTDLASYTVHDRSYGRSLTPSTLYQGIHLFLGIRAPQDPTAVPSFKHDQHEYMIRIATCIRDQLCQLKTCIKNLSGRVYGSSIIISYESPHVTRTSDMDIPVVRVGLIDFTHSVLHGSINVGSNHDDTSGVDSGALLGLNTLIGLFDSTLQTLRSSIYKAPNDTSYFSRYLLLT